MASGDDWTIEDEIADIKMGKPHVVILGAGASVAALPNGDKHGRKLPVMDNFVEVVGLEPTLKKHGIENHNQNFEALYSDLIGKASHANAIIEIERCVRDYFSNLQLPDHPTIYDHLVLSLREKDLIATFNWDPFLMQACVRNCRTAKPPQTAFLHGCVSLGVDVENKITGPIGRVSSKGKQFVPSKILFPIKNKDYNSDPFISAEWDTLKKYLKHSFVLSIFGYGAPASDVEAIALMKEAWGHVEARQFEETEMIDIKAEDVLTENWKGFIHTHHYQKWNSFYESTIATHPRRSGEATWNRLMECKWLKQNPIPKDLGFNDLYQWLQPYFDAEKNPKSKK